MGAKAADVLRVRTLAVYNFARDYARERGIIIADTKLEFGWLDDELIVIDELLHARLQPLLARRRLRARAIAAQLRQAARPRLAHRLRLEQGAAAAGAAAGGGGGTQPNGTARPSAG